MSEPLDLAVFECELAGRHLVEASAGTGKTWNLCALYVRLLVEQAHPVEQILVVTFTKAATAELRDRIRARLLQCRDALSRQGSPWRQALNAPDPVGAAAPPSMPDPLVQGLLDRFSRLGIEPGIQRERLDQAIAHFDEAAIFTIHSFCQRALADSPFSAGQALQLTVLQNDQPLIEEVVHDLWREEVLSPQAPHPLVEFIHQKSKTPTHLIDDLRARLARPTARIIWPEPSPPGPSSDRSEASDDALRDCAAGLRRLWTTHQQELLEAIEADRGALYLSLTKNEGLERSIRVWQAWLDQADPLTPIPGKDHLPLLKHLSRSGYKAKKGQSIRLRADFLDLAQQAIDMLTQRQDLGERLWLDLRRQALLTLPDALQAIKRSRQVLSFNDMLANLHQRLLDPSSSGLAVALRSRFPVALVDEFQDTDPLQFDIFNRLYPVDHPDSATPLSLFLLGDPKQAIYSFRNADLHTYLIARRSAPHQHTLRHNQRATPELIRATNHFFAHHPDAFLLDGVRYTRAQVGDRPRARFLDRRAPEQAPHCETLAPFTVWSLPGPAPETLLERPQAERLAAQVCALEIASLLRGASQDAVTLDGRPLSGADIAVLVRRRDEGERMRRELLALGISSVSMTQDSVHDSVDADELEQVLRAILEPTRIDSMRLALSTDLIGEGADTLLALEHDDDRLAQWSIRFHQWSQTWARRGIGAMVRRLMREVGVVERWLARTDGERRLTNLLHLTERLQTAARSHPQPQALLEFLSEERLDAPASETSIMRLESDRALVRILTIHKSKGLEFPVVFCPFLWNSRIAGVSGDFGPGAHYHDDTGHPLIDQRLSTERGEEQKSVQKQIQLEQAAEAARLIYVALTRAQHRLVMIGGQALGGRRKDDPQQQANKGAASVLNWMIAGGAAPLDTWLAGGVDARSVDTHWQAWALACPDAIRWSPIPAIPRSALSRAQGVVAESIAALPGGRRVRPGWRMGSYSSLVHGIASEQGASDFDQRVRSETAPSSPTRQPPSDPLGFPRGAQAGVCIHALLERVDFQQPSEWPGWIDRVLKEFPPEEDRQPSLQTAHWPQQLNTLLTNCLSTRLPGGFRLADIPKAHRLNELEFMLSVAQLQPQRLQGLLETHSDGTRLPAFDTLRGYLRGFIDLVFMHEGRYFVLDWKSNHLGDHPNNYHPERLQQVMSANHYDFQSLLYCCALHRYLKQRLRHYNFDQHFGGSLYLFVRGVRPDWHTPEGQVCGVHLHRPAGGLLQDMDRLLAEHGLSGHPARSGDAPFSRGPAP